MHLTRLQMIVIVVAGLGTAGIYYLLFQQPAVAPQACTDEARICPDGSAVGRTGPNCSFAPCPSTNSNSTNTNTSINTNTTQDRVDAGCYIGGCSSEVCSDQPDVVTTCELREEYACYRAARCVKKTNGACGWESTPALTACLDEHTDPITDSEALEVRAVTENAEFFDGQEICMTGWYQSSFEFTAIGPDVSTDADGIRRITEPYVELYSAPDEATDCQASGNTQVCTAQVTECGKFNYAAPGETGYGMSGNIRYQLDNR